MYVGDVSGMGMGIWSFSQQRWREVPENLKSYQWACHTRVVNVTKWQWRWKLTWCEIRWEAAVTGLLWGIAVFLQLRCLITICPCICSLCRARGGNRGGIRVSKKMLDTNHLRCMMINKFSLITIQCLSITVETKYGGQIESKLEKVANIL